MCLTQHWAFDSRPSAAGSPSSPSGPRSSPWQLSPLHVQPAQSPRKILSARSTPRSSFCHAVPRYPASSCTCARTRWPSPLGRLGPGDRTDSRVGEHVSGVWGDPRHFGLTPEPEFQTPWIPELSPLHVRPTSWIPELPTQVQLQLQERSVGG